MTAAAQIGQGKDKFIVTSSHYRVKSTAFDSLSSATSESTHTNAPIGEASPSAAPEREGAFSSDWACATDTRYAPSAMSHALALSPSGHLFVRPDEQAEPKLSPEVAARLTEGFAASAARGLELLASGFLHEPLPATFVFWRGQEWKSGGRS